MSTITKEQLRERARQKVKSLELAVTQSAFADSRAELEEELELARIALASLEAEDVGEVVLGEYDDCGCHPDARVACIASDGQADWENFKDGTRLFTAPPASAVNAEPVSFDALRDAVAEVSGAPAMEWSDIYKGHQAVPFINFNSLARIVDKFRAAMLQGAEPVTTANKLSFEQWLSQQTGTIDVECGCVMTEVFFHWLRVAYEAGNSPVIPDGWVLVPIEPTYQMCEAMGLPWESPRFPDRYKAMIAAAPQQEAK
ncbi:TPA: hypothetical protein LU102_000088 [Enterobacter hormaechei subsp. xiangfangensis]|nr:hypothetical protein [Enterobacter hormaechei subsp. xiangfangensis]